MINEPTRCAGYTLPPVTDEMVEAALVPMEAFWDHRRPSYAALVVREALEAALAVAAQQIAEAGSVQCPGSELQSRAPRQ